MKWCWILSKTFSAYFERFMWFLYLLLFICCITFIDLHMLNHPWILGMKLAWSCYMVFWICCWVLFASICESLCLYSLKILVYNSPFWLHNFWVLEWVLEWVW
jgi:hypothetical protein